MSSQDTKPQGTKIRTSMPRTSMPRTSIEGSSVIRSAEQVAQTLPAPARAVAGESRFGCMRETIEFLGDVVEPLSAEDWKALR